MIDRNSIFDYPNVLRETLLACGGQTCLDRFNAIPIESIEEKPKVKQKPHAEVVASAKISTTVIQNLLDTGAITDPQMLEYAQLRCNGAPFKEIQEIMCLNRGDVSLIVRNILSLEQS